MRWNALLDRVRSREGGRAPDSQPHTQVVGTGTATLAPERPSHLVDAHTRTYWARGSGSQQTLVEVQELTGRAARRAPASQRVAALLSGQDETEPTRQLGNPAFSEAVFVELMRAERYDRAYALLAPDCQRAWGDATAFARAHSGGALTNLRGVDVISSTLRDSWSEPTRNVVHENVAELEVEYTFGRGDQAQSRRQTVHLVAVEGKWRSLCYPPSTIRP